MSFIGPSNIFLAFIRNQKKSTINLTSIIFTQIEELNFIPSLLISFEGFTYISNMKFNFNSDAFTSDYLFIINQGYSLWIDSENKFEFLNHHFI